MHPWCAELQISRHFPCQGSQDSPVKNMGEGLVKAEPGLSSSLHWKGLG